jgi:hypothetical protein
MAQILRQFESQAVGSSAGSRKGLIVTLYTYPSIIDQSERVNFKAKRGNTFRPKVLFFFPVKM